MADQPDRSTLERGGLGEVLGASLRLGLTSFGGPIAHIGYFRHEYVERRRWLGEAQFADLLALCQALPGPASSQLGIAIGTIRAGRLGGIVAWLGFTLPSAVALVTFGLLTATVDLAEVGWVRGLKLAAVAIVAQAVLAMWRSLAPDIARSALVLGAAVAALALPSPTTQVAIIGAGWLIGRVALSPPADSPTGSAPVGGRHASILLLGLFGVLLVGLPVLRSALEVQGVALAETFYRAGSLVFGGGHVVLPLLHEAVVPVGWVGEDRFLAGYGAAQAVPGPLFTFAGYLGASMGPEPNGVPGGVLALVAIFLPSFLLVWGVLPFWDALRANHAVRRSLVGVNAAVVGILLAALITPVWTSAVGGPVDVAIAAIAAGLLIVARAPPWAVVVLTALAAEIASGLA